MPQPTLHEQALFEQQVAGGQSSAAHILPLLFEFFRPRSVVDVGCGDGPWLNCANALGVTDVFGLAGDDKNQGRLLIEADRIQAVDLSVRFQMNRRFDLAISVEVADHLPFQRSETFVADLVALSDVVLFSAALPFQGGENHINEQWLEFWAILFRRHGYVACDCLRQQLWTRTAGDYRQWQNLLIFCRRDRAAELFPPDVMADDRPLSRPHPLTILVNAARYRPLAAEAVDFEQDDYFTLLKAHLAGETLLPPLRVAGAISRESGIALFPSARTVISDVRAEMDRKDRAIARLNDALAEREEERSRVIAELAATTESFRLAISALTSRSEESKWLAGELDGSGAQPAASEAQFRRLTTNLINRRDAGGRLGAELAADSQEARHQRGEIEFLSRQLVAHKAELRRVRAKNRKFETRKTGIQLQVEERSRSLQAQEHELHRVMGELDGSRHTVEALRSSWSWRVTTPLRAVAGLGLVIQRLIGGRGSDVPLRSKLLGLLQFYWFGKQVRATGLFDEPYYVRHSPDVALGRHDPLRHFFVFGAAEGRNPHPLFDLHYYLGRNPDLAKSNINPVVHYLRWGAQEGRDPHPHFDTRFYLDRNPDVRQGGLNPLQHFMQQGAAQGLDPNPHFDTSEYLERHPDDARKGGNPLLHYLEKLAASRPGVNRDRGERHRAAATFDAPAENIEPQTNELRDTLRAEYELSGRPPLTSDYDSIPLVSVLIPCFNYGHYLEDAIVSAMTACSYPMEIIVVDDGSTDEGSIAAVAELAERYHFRLVRQANTGLTGARRTALRHSRGKFIQFLDADDMLAPGKIDLQVDMMTGARDIDIAVCEYELCDGDGGNRRLVRPSTLAGYSFRSEDFLLQWERGFCLPIHCALFRMDVLAEDQFPDITKAGKEDWIFWIVLAARAPRFQFHSDVHATYRIHGRNTFTDSEGMGLDFLRASMYVLQSGLNTCDNFLEESVKHFRSAYLGSIKHAAIVWTKTHGE